MCVVVVVAVEVWETGSSSLVCSRGRQDTLHSEEEEEDELLVTRRGTGQAHMQE